MRYYRIELTNSVTGKPLIDAARQPIGPYTSFDAKTGNVPGALNVEMDIPVFTFDAPVGAAYLKIWGVGLQSLAFSSQLNPDFTKNVFTTCKVYGGMQKGLPLANPKQAGLLLSGTVMQAFGNWQGTQQTLDLIVNADFGSAQNPRNIVLNWGPHQQLGAALAQALTVAFPGKTVVNNIGANLTLPYDPQAGAYQTVGQLATYAKAVSQSIMGGQYAGVKILATEKGFLLFDGSGTGAANPKQISFQDLIGQPVWLDLATINFKTVMRYDLAVGDYIKMPNAQQTNTAQSMSQFRDRATFQGVFLVTGVRHMGHFRQKSADSWVTSFDAVMA